MNNGGSASLRVKKLVCAGACLALALVLPFLTGQIPQIGQALSPMHIPVMLCGFLCGWPWGLAVGVIAPPLRFLLFGMPPIFPAGAAMALELGVYGALTGLLYKALPRKTWYLYAALVVSMIAGRLAWGAARFFIAGLQGSTFTLQAFWAGAVANAVPGIICHIALIPPLVLALRRAKLCFND